MTEQSEPTGYWRIGQATAAIAAGCVALGALAALTVVASVHGSDALSTVALSLAILSFVIQIIVFLAQTGSSNQQVRRSEEVHTGTITALAKITQEMEGTHETVSRVEQRLDAGLVAAQGRTELPDSTRAIAEATDDPELSPEQLRTDLARARREVDFERIYGLILGSQVDLLRDAVSSENGSVERIDVAKRLAQAKLRLVGSPDEPGPIDAWTIEQYLNFLLNNGLLAQQPGPPDGPLLITEKGRELLTYLDGTASFHTPRGG